ncbi:MAG: S9 family peptidase [Verrucomicrobia bacterium]|nr:S9 family peptidase [Verrucomicrobiota bacterium]
MFLRRSVVAGSIIVPTFVFAGANPPHAPEKPHEITEAGHTRNDPFFWLRQKDNPEVLKYLQAENRYTESALQPLGKLQETLYHEMRGRIKESDVSVPDKIGDYYYYSRTEAGKQYGIFCRKRGSLDAKEEVLLDENELAKGQNYFRIGMLSVSRDHKLLAYSTDLNGSEDYVLRIKSLESGVLLPDRIENCSSSFAWANDNKTFFYGQLDEAHRPYKALKHVLGTTVPQDATVYEEKDDRFFLEISKSRDEKLIFVSVESELSSEVRFLDADRPDQKLRLIRPRENEVLYYVENHRDRFFIVTNENAKNFKIVEAPVCSPGKENWKEFIPYDPEVKIDSVDAFENYLAISERLKGLPAIRIYDLKSGESHQINFDEPAYEVSLDRNPVFDTNIVRLDYSSFTTPDSVIDYDMVSRQKELRKEKSVLGGYQKSDYESERIFAKAGDGVEIPISLVYKKGFKKNGTAPILLSGYGAYGVCSDADFDSNTISLLDRGFVFAIAHIRGGGELGRRWYEEGKLLNKKNTFSDFICCAQYLIDQRYADSKRVAILGGSAGGLLMGAVMNMRPDLFKTVIALVPFVDLLDTMSDPSLPLTVTEYEEWGNPQDPKLFDYMASYSPYDNVQEKQYPNLLVTAGLNDPRVSYWEPAKWVAKQRTLKHQNRILLLKTYMGAGHGGESGRFERLKETAMEYAFAIDTLRPSIEKERAHSAPNS